MAKAIKALAKKVAEIESDVDNKRSELQELESELKGLRLACAILNTGKKRSGLKQKLLNLLDEAGAEGLNSPIAVEMAAKKGDEILVQSVSSLLSKFAKWGVVAHVNGRYILKQHYKPEVEKNCQN